MGRWLATGGVVVGLLAGLAGCGADAVSPHDEAVALRRWCTTLQEQAGIVGAPSLDPKAVEAYRRTEPGGPDDAPPAGLLSDSCLQAMLQVLR